MPRGKKTYEWPTRIYKKKLNLTSFRGNANQNHNEISLHSVRMAIINKTRNSKR